MATANSLDDFLSTEIDESAVSALVGSLESRLASPTHKEPSHSIPDSAVNNNHLSNASTPPACTSVYLQNSTTQGQKGLTVPNNVIVNSASLSHLKTQQSESQIMGLNSIINSNNASLPGGCVSPLTVNNSNRSSPVNHAMRIVPQQQSVINSRNSPSPSLNIHQGNVTLMNAISRASTPNQVSVTTSLGQPAISSVANSNESANRCATDIKPVVSISYNSVPNSSHLVVKQENLKTEADGSPQHINQSGSPSVLIKSDQRHPQMQAIQTMPGIQTVSSVVPAAGNVSQTNLHLVNAHGKGQTTVSGNPSVITVRTPGQSQPSQVVMRPHLITSQSNSPQMQVVNVSHGANVPRPTGVVHVTQSKTLQPRAVSGPIRTSQINIAPRPGQTNTITLPAGMQIPQAGMLIKNEQGHIVLVQQQPQQVTTTLPSSLPGQRIQYVRPPGSSPSHVRGQAGTQIVAIQQPPHTGGQHPAVLRQPPPGTTTPGQIQTVVRATTAGQIGQMPIQPAIPVSGSHPSQPHQQPLDNVKKCKNFLSTLIKLASSQPQQTVKNVRELIQGLIDGKVEPQTFTEKLQIELKSSPQPYLVPFLKKSLPLLRQSLIANKMTIEGVRAPPLEVLQQPVVAMVQQPGAIPSIPQAVRGPQPLIQGAKVGPVPIRQPAGKPFQITRQPAAIPKTVIGMAGKGPPQQTPGLPSATVLHSRKDSTPLKEKTKYESNRDDDDINDVATMGGVNLSEESKNMASNADFIGTQIRSCKDEAFLFHGALLSRISAIAKRHGLEEVSHEVVNLISHATQERLRDVLEKLGTIAEHRIEIYKINDKFESTKDVKSQLKFVEELDKLEKKRHEEQEWEKIMKAAKSRSKNEDPEQQKIKQKAKELQQAEIERMRQEEANQTALAAIGPRKKRRTDFGEISTAGPSSASSSNGISSSSGRSAVSRPRIKRVTLRDVLFFMEQERSLTKSNLLYKTFLK